MPDVERLPGDLDVVDLISDLKENLRGLLWAQAASRSHGEDLRAVTSGGALAGRLGGVCLLSVCFSFSFSVSSFPLKAFFLHRLLSVVFLSRSLSIFRFLSLYFCLTLSSIPKGSSIPKEPAEFPSWGEAAAP